MSLDTLRDLRRAGSKPDAPVKVILGTRHTWLQEWPDMVLLRESDNPSLMDWRPLVGLPVVILAQTNDAARTLSVVEAVIAAGARLLGAVDPDGSYPIEERGSDTHRLFKKTWEAVCQS
jgi:hypothetical protein